MAFNTIPFHGKKVRFEKNGTAVDYAMPWTLNVTVDMADSTPAGASWKNGVPGLKAWSGTLPMMFVAGNTEQKALMDNVLADESVLVTDIKLLLDGSTNAFTGNMWLTGLGVNPSMSDKVGSSINFQGDGALALTDAA